MGANPEPRPWSVWSRGAGRLARSAGELLFSVLLVGLFFAVFLAIYDLSFPQGTLIGDLVRRDGAGLQTVELDLDLRGESGGAAIATLRSVRRSVKEKPAGGIAWHDASSGIGLNDHHAVQTFERSGATIDFDGDSRLDVEENSLIVLRDSHRSRRSRTRQATLVVLTGGLQGRVTAPGEEELMLEIVGSSGTLRVDSREAAATDFATTANPDGSSTFSVMEGQARVDAAGRMVPLGRRQAVTVDSAGRILGPVALPDIPETTAPAADSVLTYRSAPPPVELDWAAAGSADGYRVVIARDPAMTETVYRGEVPGAGFTHGALSEGVYYWRVSGLAGRAAGPPSPPRRFEVRQDREPPPLSVSLPREAGRDGRLLVAGETEADAEVFIGEHRLRPGADGRFEHELRLDPGVNVVVVEAMDPAGNTTYRSELVLARRAGMRGMR